MLPQPEQGAANLAAHRAARAGLHFRQELRRPCTARWPAALAISASLAGCGKKGIPQPAPLSFSLLSPYGEKLGRAAIPSAPLRTSFYAGCGAATSVQVLKNPFCRTLLGAPLANRNCTVVIVV